jgi:hypothetical protein
MKKEEYSRMLENKLVEEFRRTFQEKLGYKPIIITRSTEDIPSVSLETLDEIFEEFIPEGEDLKSMSRKREIVDLRAIYCYFAKNMNYSLKTIGNHLGNRDHTTVIHNIDIFFSQIETNKFLVIYQAIKEKLLKHKISYEIFEKKYDKMRELFLLRGVPGAGKSTLAKTIGGVHFEADAYFLDMEGNYKFDPTKLKYAHEWCKESTEQAMKKEERKIIVSNTFTQEWEMESYFELANIYEYRVHSLIVENRHGGSNVHGVPKDKLEQMKKRFEVKL